MEELARMCMEASAAGRVRWHPERYERTYLDWLRGIRDWCVSRQLWLGHRIPVYTCANGHQFAAVDPPPGCPECGSTGLTEDPDVLDTWFSSALWPFATLGWPEATPELEAFYPTSLNSTARDIINLWVTRMIFSGLFFMDEVPFSDVIVHATIQATDGRRMSKSLGTGIDPREIVARYGKPGLYTQSLFSYGDRALEAMNPAIELGRELAPSGDQPREPVELRESDGCVQVAHPEVESGLGVLFDNHIVGAVPR